MTDYSVINNVNVFVWLGGFIHLTSWRVLLESSTRTTSTLDHFLVLSGRWPPLRSDHATVRAYDHICRILLKQQAEIDVSRSRCLVTIMRSSIHCMPLIGQIRRSACDIVGPRATARNTTHSKTSQRNKAYTSLFFWYYMYKKYSKVIASIFLIHIICYHESTTQYSTFGIPTYVSICRMPVTLFMQLRKLR